MTRLGRARHPEQLLALLAAHGTHRPVGFWDAYRSSLKPREVEEPIDLWLHRTLGYVIARLSLPTPVTPNQLTVLSIVMAIASSICLVVPFPYHFLVSAGCLVMSAVLDCSDGMLARMRRSSSELGRMLDGAADTVSLLATIGANAWLIYGLHRSPWWQAALAMGGTALTVYTSQLHTLTYDHYKNVWCRLTIEGSREGEDLERAVFRFAEARRHGVGLVRHLAFRLYLGYLTSQRSFLARLDPQTPLALDALPPYSPTVAAIYRAHALGPMRTLRNHFGVGSLVFGIAVFDAFGRPDLYMLFRVVILNALFWLSWAPRQRRASREAFAEAGITPRSC